MKKRFACFACTTPYQLMGAISIVQEESIEADLYLIGTFDGYKEVAERLESYHIFNKIIPVSSERNRNVNRFKVIWQVLRRRKIAKSFLEPNLTYQYYFSSSKAYVKLFLFYELRRRNPLINYVIYEDGTGTYSKYAPSLNSSNFTRLFEFITLEKAFKPELTSIMVHFPKLLWLPDDIRGIPARAMPSFDLSDNNKRMLQDVFGMAKGDSVHAKIILFDTARGVYRKDTTDIGKLDECFKCVVDIFPQHDVILKAHPKSNETTSLPILIYEHSEIPMEVLYSEMTDLDDCILIGNHTTALYTPKMMFGKEPIIISLHEIVWSSKPQISIIFERFKSMYERKERAFAPKDVEELKKYLSQLCQK